MKPFSTFFANSNTDSSKCVGFSALAEEKEDAELDAMRKATAERIRKQRQYLLGRGKCTLTQHFQYTPAAGTDVENTWREYVSAEIPHMKDMYSFLFK